MALDEASSLEKKMISIDEEVKREDTQEIEKKLVTIYGGLELDSDEIAFLSLGPDFSLLEELDLEQANLDFNIGLTKV